jgi:hypothetical protein
MRRDDREVVMEQGYYWEPKAAVAIVAGGVGLSFAAAVIPHFTAGYRLEPVILVPGLILYLIYGLLAYFLHGRIRIIPGAVVLALHFFLVAQERWLTDSYQESSLLCWFPLLLAVGLLALVPEARRGARYPREDAS